MKIVKNCRAIFFFFCWFCLTKHDGNHAFRWIRDLWSNVYRKFWYISRRFWVFPFWIIFSILIFCLVFVYSWSTLLWYRWYYTHRLRDSMSLMCEIFFLFFLLFFILNLYIFFLLDFYLTQASAYKSHKGSKKTSAKAFLKGFACVSGCTF